MSRKLRQKVSVYLPADEAERYQNEAARRGISLSGYMVETLSVREQIERLQEWLEGQFNSLKRGVTTGVSAHSVLALAGLDHLPEDVLLGILRQVASDVEKLTPQKLDSFAKKGRELQPRSNGAVH